MPLTIPTRTTTKTRLTVCGRPVLIDTAREIVVARRSLGARKGWAVRLTQDGAILTEWRETTTAGHEARYLAVLRDLAAHRGFAGVTQTSSDRETVTGEGIDWSGLEGGM